MVIVLVTATLWVLWSAFQSAPLSKPAQPIVFVPR